jgi:hypothetical protein
MRKSIFVMVLSLVAVLAVACGGGANNKPAGNGGNTATGGCSGGENGGGGDAADAYALYKKKGRTWLVKNDMDAGGTKMISYSKTEVVDVADDHAMIKMWTLGEDKKPMAGMPEPEPTKIPFATADTTATTDAPEVETKEETVTVAAGEFECIVTDTAGTKVWSSKKYPGLTVKMESSTMKSELVEFNE